jgi:GR25 family glycosyltransferase involved in LPS biosynthesis
MNARGDEVKAQAIEVIYLNLGSAVARRDAFEARYAACRFAPHWTLHRFHAIDAQHELVRNAKGRLSPGNKGCYFSSLECIRQSFGNDKHLFIVDDDIDFCAATQLCVDRSIALLPEDGWDIMLTDTAIPCAVDMPWLTMLWHTYTQDHIVRMLDLAETKFTFCAGSTLTNRRSKEKIYDLMMVDDFSKPWDLAVRQHIQQGRIKAVLIFPFVTTVGKRGDISQISPDDPKRMEQLLCNEFRRMMWIGNQPKPFYSEWARKEYRDLISDEVVRLNSIMLPLLSLQMGQVAKAEAVLF